MGDASDEDVDSGWDDLAPPELAEAPTAEDSAAGNAPIALVRRSVHPPPPSAATRALDDGSIGPSAIHASEVVALRGGYTKLAAFAALAALAAGGVIWLRSSAEAPQSHAAAPATQTLPATVGLPAATPPGIPELPAVAPAPAPTVATAPAASEPVVAPVKQTDSVSVAVKSVPEGAVFFEAGQRLGTTLVNVSVARKSVLRLTALLDGYEPLNFRVDGSRDALTVRLRPARPTPTPTAAPEAAPPADPSPAE